jgi:restriction system protein
VGRGRYNPYLEQERLRAAAARRQAAEIRARDVQERRNLRLREQAHLHDRVREVDENNREIADQIKDLESLLVVGVGSAKHLDFHSLRREVVLPVFDALGRDQPAPEPAWSQFEPKRPGLFASIVPGSAERNQEKVTAARQAFDAKHAEWADYEQKRTIWLAAARLRYELECAALRKQVEEQNAELDEFEAAYRARDPEAQNQYFGIVLERDQLPEGFPHTTRVAYVKESKQLVVERQLPTVDIVPTVSTYRYVKTTDSITSATRPAIQIRETYVKVVSQLALRTLNLLFVADVAGAVDSIVLNCFVDTISPETGQRITPCLLTVRTTREVLDAHDLTKVDAIACLRHLNAEVSPRPHELKAVRPILAFNMVDPRFINKPDVLSQLDQRPNLAVLTPLEFEGLITNLFEKMGLETRLTQASRDGGVDCVAWDMRPIVGGKVIVQAKRYKHTVGVSAVRDLYGTVLNEGAAKGILVTTSGYGTASFQFAGNKPLQLISGGELLYLLDQYTSVKAKIEFPEEWVDPRPDMVEAGVPIISVQAPTNLMAETTPIANGPEPRVSISVTDHQNETGPDPA